MSTASPGFLIDWAVAARALPGESVSGDMHVVEAFPRGALAAVIDGLGHGPEAAEAAAVAAATLREDPGASVLTHMTRCHEALRRTRGAAMSVASFSYSTRTVSWVGVGNVEGILLRAERTAKRESIILRGGVVGYGLPPLRETQHGLGVDDTLILATDGIRPHFVDAVADDREPQAIADDLLARHAKPTDDALVLVVRCRGGER
jgi:hypothetical protein